MTTDEEIDRALATVSATLNDQQLEEYDRGRVQEVVDEALGGEWIVERQNSAAENSDQAIPAVGPQSKLRELMTRLHVMKP